MRADARENRRRVLEAAEAVFAEDGLDASTEEIARRAGLGIATVFRHFPTKRDLVENSLLTQFEKMTEWAHDAESATDATRAFIELSDRLIEHMGTKVAMARFLFGGTGVEGPARQASDELDAVITSVLHRAQAEGGVRNDVGTADLYFLFRGLVQPRTLPHGDDGARLLARRIIMDGLLVASGDGDK